MVRDSKGRAKSMRFLRTASTRRLLSLIAGVVVAISAGAAIAVAATSGGPVPAPEPLATAVHDALAAPPVAGITARVTFTNNLIASSQIQGSDPLLTGASGRLWIAPGHLRLELQSDNGDAQVVVNGQSFWIYDPSSNDLYQGTLPGNAATGAGGSSSAAHQIPTIVQIQTEIDKLAGHLAGLAALPADVAGQPAYSMTVTPKVDGGMLGAVQLAWDAAHGVPLSFAIYAKGDPNPVISVQATDISYGAVPDSVFAISPPSGANVVSLSASNSPDQTSSPVSITPPATAGGLALTAQRQAKGGAALLTYGHGLGAVEVVVRADQGQGHAGALPGAGTNGSNGSNGSLTLPTVQVNGAQATELATELGTVLEFKRAGLDYLVFGSVPPATAIAVARAL